MKCNDNGHNGDIYDDDDVDQDSRNDDDKLCYSRISIILIHHTFVPVYIRYKSK